MTENVADIANAELPDSGPSPVPGDAVARQTPPRRKIPDKNSVGIALMASLAVHGVLLALLVLLWRHFQPSVEPSKSSLPSDKSISTHAPGVPNSVFFSMVTPAGPTVSPSGFGGSPGNGTVAALEDQALNTISPEFLFPPPVLEGPQEIEPILIGVTTIQPLSIRAPGTRENVWNTSSNHGSGIYNPGP